MNDELVKALPELQKRARTFRENLKAGVIPDEYVQVLRLLAEIERLKAAEKA